MGYSSTGDELAFLLETDRCAEAAEEIALAIREKPHDFALRFLAADAAERLGTLASAADHLSVVLTIEPQHLDANRRQAGILAELGDNQGSIRCWRRVVAATEHDTDASTLLAIALSSDGQHEEAIDVLGQLTREHPRDAAAFSNLGMALLAAGREDEGLAALTRALQLEPRSAQAYCGLGIAHQRRGQWTDAAAAFRAAERLAPDSAVGSLNLGLALEHLGDRDGARRALLRAAALEPEDEEIQQALEPVLVRPSSTPEVATASDPAASIKGDLKSFDLLNVLEFLRLQEKTGSLVVSAPAGVGIVRMERGMLIGGSAPGMKRLGEILVGRGLVSRGNLQFALSRQQELYPGLQEDMEQNATTLGAVLLRERLVNKEHLSGVLFQMILHVMKQVNEWREGAFAFHASEDSGFPIRFNLQQVVLDLMRLEDERQRPSREPSR